MARLGELDCDRLGEGALRYLAEMKETATQPGHDQPGWQTVLVDVSIDALRNRPTTTDVNESKNILTRLLLERHSGSNETRDRRSEGSRRSWYYNGPASDHFDGMRFFDPAGAPPRSRARSVALDDSEALGGLGALTLCRSSTGAGRGFVVAHLLCRPCELAGSDRRTEPPARPDLVAARVAVSDPGQKNPENNRNLALPFPQISPRCLAS
jgi:hypothetical protein